MPRRRDWDSLSPAYRSRLTKGGITKRAYESGASLKAARGHEFTPERPQDARRNPSEFELYRAGKSRVSGRYISVVTVDGVRSMRLSSRDRKIVARHWNALRKWAREGDPDALTPYWNLTVTDVDTGRAIALETDPLAIWNLTHSRQLNVDSIYEATT